MRNSATAFFCLLYGLDLRNKRPSVFARSFSIVWFAGFALWTYVELDRSSQLLAAACSLSELADYADDLFVGVVWLFASVYLVLFRRDAYVDLLRIGDSFCAASFRRVLVMNLLGLPYVAVFIVRAYVCAEAGDYLMAVGSFVMGYVSHTQTFFLTTYIEAVAAINWHHRAVTVALSGSSSDKNVVATVHARKRVIRAKIESLNRIYSIPLALCYLQVFLAALRIISLFIVRPTNLMAFLFSSGHVGFVVQLFLLASESSKLIQASRSLDLRLIDGQYSWRGSDHWDTFYTWLSLHHRDDVDAPTVGPFLHRSEGLLQYLATSVTCVSVVLQFDFRVVATVNRLANSNESGWHRSTFVSY